METKIVELAVAGAATFVALLVGHLTLRRKMRPPWTYSLGVFILGLSFSILVGALWRDWWTVLVLWVLVGCGGLPVWAGYYRLAIQENKLLRQCLNRLAEGRDGEDIGEMGLPTRKWQPETGTEGSDAEETVLP